MLPSTFRFTSTPGLRSAVLAAAVLFNFISAFSAEAPQKKKPEEEVVVLERFTLDAFQVTGGAIGATTGGVKDARFFRMGAASGAVPHPSALTAEGIFSEHDLPLDLGGGGEGLFRVQSAATAARFEVLPAVRYLAQLGLSSGFDAATWRRAPLNLVAVIDKSGSMSGAPLALVRASLKCALGHLRDGDQISLVLYGDRAHVHLAPTLVSRITRARIAEEIDAIESMGSTDMESGLRVGYEVARESQRRFAGQTRVMLFTDEQPNVGNTAAEGFMAMADSAARDGIGLTTIGVGVQFNTELAARISRVRGGNQFFFAAGDEMRKTFEEDFDTLVSELAHDFSVRIDPAPGLRIEGVFGVPAEMLRWDGRAIVMDVATIFLSRRKGAIYFALAADAEDRDLPSLPTRLGDRLAGATFRYRHASDARVIHGETACKLIKPGTATAGLTRGALLVDEYLTIKRAAHLHHVANDPHGAFRLIDGLQKRFGAARDRKLNPERKLIDELHRVLAVLSGHGGEIAGRKPEGLEESSVERRFGASQEPANGLSGLPER